MTTERPTPDTRADYARFVPITTRWMDNDVYGHMNNVVYYALFDTAVNFLLVEAGALQIETGDVIGLVVETQCNYFAPVAFPDRVSAGVRVARAGTSSIRYEVGIFRNDDATAAAQGHFVHVYVDRSRRRPVPLPEAHRRLAESLVRPARGGGA